MINVSNAFKNELFNDNRNYLEFVDITLEDGAELNLTNKDLWNSGLSIDDAVSADNSFDVGSAIINKCTLVIENLDDRFSDYDFNRADVVVSVGLALPDGKTEKIRKGIYAVDEAKYNGSIITLSCLDNMRKFDKAYSESKLSYPATLNQIIRDACDMCDVELQTYDFAHDDFLIHTRPVDEATTFREVVAWCAQIAGCFARCDTLGRLEIKWYNQELLEKVGLDGGIFDGGVNKIERIKSLLSGYIGTTEGMEHLVDSKKDDNVIEITGVPWFTYNNVSCEKIYVSGNSWFDFGERSSSSSGSSSSGHLNVCRRDGALYNLYRKEGSVEGADFLKIRWEGFTNYNSQDEQYALKYELFLMNDGMMFLNALQTPTNKSYFGTSSLVCGEHTIPFEVADGTGSGKELYFEKKSETEWGVSSSAIYRYITGDDADGGSFRPWNEGDSYDGGTFRDMEGYHHIYANYSAPVLSTDDVVITGVRVLEKNQNEENQESIATYLSGAEGYIVEISDNDLIQGGNGLKIADWLGEQLIGFKFRKAQLSHASDPTIEAGDVGFVTDRKQRSYPIVISSTRFNMNGAQTTNSSAADPIKNSGVRFSAQTKNYVESRRMVEQEKTDREKALEKLGERLDNSSGLYTTEKTQPDGSTVFYMHDKPTLEESMIVWKMTAEAWSVSTDGGKHWNAGVTVDGDTIARILTATGISFDWARGGTLTLGGIDNKYGIMIVLDEEGNTITKLDRFGAMLTLGQRRKGSNYGEYSLAQGQFIEASGSFSHVVGYGSGAIGRYAFAVGQYAEALADYSVAIGGYVKAMDAGQFVIGDSNVEDPEGYLRFAIGEGLGGYVRQNSFGVGKTGTVFIGYTLVFSDSSGYFEDFDYLKSGKRRSHIEGGGGYITLNARLGPTQVDVGNGAFTPMGEVNLGTQGNRWKAIFSDSSVIQTSDRNEKKCIRTIDAEKMVSFMMALSPSSFKFINNDSDRTHYGLIAQDVEDAIYKVGMTTKDFAGFIKAEKEERYKENGEIKTKTIDGEYYYGLRYEEFIAPLISVVQTQQKEINDLKSRIEKLETLLEVR